MSSGPGGVRSIRTCHGLMINGPPVAETTLNFGAADRRAVFGGSLRVVGEWTARRRRTEKTDVEILRRVPSARTIARLMTIGRDTLSKAETVTVAAIEAGVPTLVEAREIIAEFHLMIRRKAAADLSSWIERARASLVASFACGVTNDEAAVRAAITSPCPTDRLKVRSRASNSSDAKCTIVGKLICFKPD